ncbi:hypothetical protein LXE97_00315 [Escherichia marmotae]|nr:hypothetical protein [Escherichia marmotae]MCL0881402.1 hypothetical protein [Escherichia marmotae]
MKNHGVKPVLLSRRQIEALQRIQDEERQKSVLGVGTVDSCYRSATDG